MCFSGELLAMTKGVQNGRGDKQYHHHHIAESIEDQRIVCIGIKSRVTQEPARIATECPKHQRRGTGEGAGDSDQVQAFSVTPVFHYHKTCNCDVEY